MQKHIQLLGFLYIAYNAIGLIFAWLVWGLLSGIGVMSGDAQAAGIMTLIGSIAGALIFVTSVPGIIGGIGLLKGWWWARYLVFLLAFLNLISIPLGTILGIYSFWVLMQEESVAYFDQDRADVFNAPPQG